MGRLVDRDDKYDYYSTYYRFNANEYMIRSPRNDANSVSDFYSLSTTMLPSVKETVYEISSEYGDGKVLKKIK